MMIDAMQATHPATPGAPRLGRRSVFKVGTAFIAALATLSIPQKASADCQGSPCCHLAKCNRCSVLLCGGWSCPPGYVEVCWNCASGGSWYVCGECAGGPTCFDGPWACSIWFGEAGPGCPQ